MIVKLENREYELKANGSFMKKYQDKFKESFILALYKCTQEKDVYACARLIYCASNIEETFEEWIDSFKSPLFVLPVLDEVTEFFVKSSEPTVKPINNGKEEAVDDSKKKTE